MVTSFTPISKCGDSLFGITYLCHKSIHLLDCQFIAMNYIGMMHSPYLEIGVKPVTCLRVIVTFTITYNVLNTMLNAYLTLLFSFFKKGN